MPGCELPQLSRDASVKLVQSLARLGLNKMLDALDDRQDGVVIIDGFRKLRFKHECFLSYKPC
jgi:hypothetical protein